MKRSELIEIVTRAAHAAQANNAERAALIGAVSDPSVTRVARALYWWDGCGCPATLAGLAPGMFPKTDAVEAFTAEFDAITREAGFTGEFVIEVED